MKRQHVSFTFSLWINPPKLDEKLQNFLRDRRRNTEEVNSSVDILTDKFAPPRFSLSSVLLDVSKV